ncbi:MAG: hypothetical protein JWR80_10055 [Bradyrhizobium sp.]|nr:hypothetical protein [Bradyrhizobium sp.]
MKLIRFFAGAVALLGVTLTAHAAGMFNNLPIVGGAAYCALYAGDGTTCAGNVPAGPTALTGNEKIPADTQLSGGSSPQSVLIDVSSLGAGPTQYSTPLTGVSITVAAGTRQVIVEPAGTIAALTLVLPAATGLTEGQRLGFCTTQIITTLTLTAGTGTTIMNGPTAMLVPVATGAASCVEWIYVASTTKWYRVQ